MQFGTELHDHTGIHFKTGPQPDLTCGSRGGHFEKWLIVEYVLPCNMLNMADKIKILVTIPTFSMSKNPNIILKLDYWHTKNYFSTWPPFTVKCVCFYIITNII